uniref:Uncharacterized protein n=1 Tax=Aplanochytrium stocchinoi TaxID=215587 RepID=A0A7S3PFM0_9STRA
MKRTKRPSPRLKRALAESPKSNSKVEPPKTKKSKQNAKAKQKPKPKAKAKVTRTVLERTATKPLIDVSDLKVPFLRVVSANVAGFRSVLCNDLKKGAFQNLVDRLSPGCTTILLSILPTFTA